MRFAHVTGMLWSEPEGYRIEVTLDDRRTIDIVRDEQIDTLMIRDGVPDPWWTVDQLTQETIGTTLAQLGWEAISEAERDPDATAGLPTAVYVVRG